MQVSQQVRTLADLHVVMIDNYDSFTYNLVQYLQELGLQVQTWRNDQISVAGVLASKADMVIISPGPAAPDEAGISLELVLAAARVGLPLLGVCLGHQCIGQAFGGQIVRITPPVHGKVSAIYHEEAGVFASLPNPVMATRYHSLVIAADSLPACLQVTATTGDGVIMGVRHREQLIEGVQFHPESILTVHGKDMLRRFALMALQCTPATAP